VANYSITITNSITPVGPAAPSQWGVMVWGVDRWLEGSDTLTKVQKPLTNSVSPTSDLSLSATWSRTIDNSLAIIVDPSSEELSDSAGYRYVFSRPTSNADSQVVSTYDQESTGAQSYATVSRPSTTWS
jgi:hypothetical protein